MKINIILKNINSLKRIKIFIKKVINKLFFVLHNHSNKKNIKWIRNNTSDFGELAKNIDNQLWDESLKTYEEIKNYSQEKLSKIESKLGGGGFYPLLYFFTRLIVPKNVLETGVSAGFSSLAILLAMKKNHYGHLYSSDLPYFRIKNAEDYIGILVYEELKNRWNLFIEGDENNLKEITKLADKFNLIHYDSDKSYKGRKQFMQFVSNHIDINTIILMDDIQDNSFFYDYVNKNKLNDWKIFKFENKYIGLLGKIQSYHNES